MPKSRRRKKRKSITKKPAVNQQVTGQELLVTFAIVTAFGLTGWSIIIFQLMLMPPMLPILIWILSGVAFISLFRLLRSRHKITPDYDFALMITVGSMVCWAFLFGNYRLAEEVTFNIKERITGTGLEMRSRKQRCRRPFVKIIYKGESESFDFPCDTPVEAYGYISLTLSKGAFGYDIVRRRELTD